MREAIIYDGFSIQGEGDNGTILIGTDISVRRDLGHWTWHLNGERCASWSFGRAEMRLMLESFLRGEHVEREYSGVKWMTRERDGEGLRLWCRSGHRNDFSDWERCLRLTKHQAEMILHLSKD